MSEPPKIINFFDRSAYEGPDEPPDPGQPDTHTVARLRELLALAEKGEIKGFAALVWNDEQSRFNQYIILPPSSALDAANVALRFVGGMEFLKGSMLEIAATFGMYGVAEDDEGFRVTTEDDPDGAPAS